MWIESFSGLDWLWKSSLPPYKKNGKHRKSQMVIYENIKVIESATEVYGNMLVKKRP